MDGQASKGVPIDAERLTAWDVLPGGDRIGLDFVARDGRSHRIALPFDALSGLLMTLPRMLQAALDARFAGGTLRVVQRLDAWQIEQADGDSPLVLKLGAEGGFEIAFALNAGHAESLGDALLALPQEVNNSFERKPH